MDNQFSRALRKWRQTLRLSRHATLYSLGSVASVMAALLVVAVFLLLVGRDPLQTYWGIAASAFGSKFAWSETLVAAIPLLFCGLSVAVAARVGLMSIGAEGQLHLGAAAAAYVALAGDDLPRWILLPLMFAAACVIGALWSGGPGFLRARFNVNETIVTLLLNYVAILWIEYLIRGPWQDPNSYSWPQTAEFPPAAELPGIGNSRLHIGLLVAVVIALVLKILMNKTQTGFIARFVGSNPLAARHAHYPVGRYLIVAMLISGAIAALAGLCQVSAIEGRLRTGISPGYGYTGFLVSWLARHDPVAILVASVLMGGLISGGDSLQIDEGLPYATVNILQSCIFFFLLCSERSIQRFAITPSQEESHD